MEWENVTIFFRRMRKRFLGKNSVLRNLIFGTMNVYQVYWLQKAGDCLSRGLFSLSVDIVLIPVVIKCLRINQEYLLNCLVLSSLFDGSWWNHHLIDYKFCTLYDNLWPSFEMFGSQASSCLFGQWNINIVNFSKAAMYVSNYREEIMAHFHCRTHIQIRTLIQIPNPMVT